MKALRGVLISIVILVGIATVALPLSWVVRRGVYASSYSEIGLGDSAQKVVQLYGSPEESSDCSEFRRPSAREQIKKDCVKVYWYKSWFEQWIFFFDGNDRVIHKVYNVLY